MLILFGWGHKKFTNYGPVYTHDCSNCNNISKWHLSKVTTYFEFFFIPVVPYSTKYYLSCPVCDKATRLTTEHFEYFKNFTLLNNALNQETISDEDYEEMITKLKESAPDILKDTPDWDFDEDKLNNFRALEKDFTLLKFLKFAIPIFLIFLLFYLL